MNTNFTTQALGFLIGITFFYTSSLGATTGKDSNSRYGTGEDSLNCIRNISLFVPYAKNGQYADAYPFWEKAYRECPASSKNIYLYGVKIMRWKIDNETEAGKKEELISSLFDLYDQRMLYFGDDAKYPTSWIQGNKALEYINYRPNEVETIYNLLSQSVNGGGGASSPEVLRYFVEYSDRMIEKNPAHKSLFMNDYIKASSLLGAMVGMEGMNEEQIQLAQKSCDEVASRNGALDGRSLENTFAPEVEANKNNIGKLQHIISMFNRSHSQSSDTYFKACQYAYAIQPNVENCVGLATYYSHKGDLNTSGTYFEKAVSVAKDTVQKLSIYGEATNLMLEKKSFSLARKFALNIASLDANNGKPYLLIASMYAKSASSLYPQDRVLAACVYYAVIEKAEKAKAVDSSCEEEANKIIRTYTAYLPSANEVFMHPDIEKGKTFHIGGWIQENVVVK